MNTNETQENTNFPQKETLLINNNENEHVETVRPLEDESGSGFQVWPLRYAGFWMRFWAYSLDLMVVGSLDRILIKPLFRWLDLPIFEFNMFAPISVASAITFYFYFILMTKFSGQTLGKMVFGLKVINLKGEKLSWGTVLFREWIGRFISSTIIIGYVVVAFLPRKQGLHDVFADTSVVHVDR